MTHPESGHERGSMYMVEGRRPPSASGVNASGNPQLGSVVAQQLGVRGGLPPFVSIPGNDLTSRFTGHGWLPATSAPFRGFEAPSLRPSGEVTADRFRDRLELRRLIAGGGPPAAGWDRFDQRAVDIITSGRGAEAFDISRESEETKALYGVRAQGDDMGKLTLQARRLVEAGVRFVTVGRDSWDHHEKIFPALRSRLPKFDDAFSGLVIDLERRGLLSETLVVYLTEYGRTPKVNDKAGRDHWPAAFSVAFAGAGIKAGQVIGASDKQGAAVVDRPVSPEEIAATLLHLAGIHPQTMHVRASDGRPMMFVDEAKPVGELLA